MPVPAKVTFVCADCGTETTLIVPRAYKRTPTVCTTCEVIRNAPEKDRPELRRVLRKERKP